MTTFVRFVASFTYEGADGRKVRYPVGWTGEVEEFVQQAAMAVQALAVEPTELRASDAPLNPGVTPGVTALKGGVRSAPPGEAGTEGQEPKASPPVPPPVQPLPEEPPSLAPPPPSEEPEPAPLMAPAVQVAAEPPPPSKSGMPPKK
jgi:hypothetical protein